MSRLQFWKWNIFDHFSWDHGATLLAAVISAAIAVAVARATYLSSQESARRERMATVYAEALRSVEDYLEGPYRIRRRAKDQRAEVSQSISDVKSRNNYYRGLLRLHAPDYVAAAFDGFVKAAIKDAGPQMTQAWRMPLIKRDRDMPLGSAYNRTSADAAKVVVLAAMARSLREGPRPRARGNPGTDPGDANRGG